MEGKETKCSASGVFITESPGAIDNYQIKFRTPKSYFIGFISLVYIEYVYIVYIFNIN